MGENQALREEPKFIAMLRGVTLPSWGWKLDEAYALLQRLV